MFNKIYKKSIALFIAMAAAIALAACGQTSAVTSTSETTTAETTSAQESTAVFNSEIIKNEKFNAVEIEVSPEDFNSYGFTLGDSVNLEFSNGFILEDVPYYNGFYVKAGEPVMAAYPGASNLIIKYNYGTLWDDAELSETDTITITLNTKAKYLETQEALSLSYSNEKEDAQTDEEFTNFRALTGGNLKENFLFRGASSVDNTRGRAAYVDELLSENGINFVMDLADSEEDLAGYMAADDFNSPYAKSIYESGKMVLLALGSNFQSESFRTSLTEGLRKMTEYGGPAYIHCQEGKDRAGFVCMLLEALAGASYDEMLNDYMKSYENYYGLTKETDSDKYDIIVDLYFNTYLNYISGISDKEELTSSDFTEYAREYLLGSGMTNDEIDALVEMITK